MTLLTYLTEINKAGATFFQEYMANNPIPYAFWASGKVKGRLGGDVHRGAAGDVADEHRG